MVMFATSYLDMNQDSPAFRNENIRKAMQIGFDRDALADEILNDGSVGAEGIGEEPNLTLLVWDESRERDVGTFLQSQFEENLGAKVEVRVLPFDQLVEQTAAG